MKILKFIIFVVVISSYLFGNSLEQNENFNLIMSSNMLNGGGNFQDVNGTKEELVNFGVPPKVAELIVNYRKKTGGFKNIGELKRIKGIKKSTYEKLIKKLQVKSAITKKPLYINEADDETFIYYGLSKKEIKEIRIYLKKHKKFKNNLDLMGVFSRARYNKYKLMIKYDK